MPSWRRCGACSALEELFAEAVARSIVAATSSCSATAVSMPIGCAIPALLACRRAPPPDPCRQAHPVLAGSRNRRGARSPPLLPAGRLRRGGDQPLPRLRHHRRHVRAGHACRVLDGNDDADDPDDILDTYHKNYVKAIDKGLLKIFSKMGISTLQSYCGAQIFDIVGLKPGLRRRSTSPAPLPRRRRRPGRDRAKRR